MPCCGSSSSEDPLNTWRWASNRPGGDRLGRNTYEKPLESTPDCTFGWNGSGGVVVVSLVLPSTFSTVARLGGYSPFSGLM